MTEKEKNIHLAESSGGKFIFSLLFVLSIISFISALISLWQGIIRLKGFSGEFEDLKELFHSLLTFQNDGIILIIGSFFLFIVALQLSLYALLVKK